MSSLVFLLSKKLKNRLREMLRRPAEILVFLLLAAMIVITVISGNAAHTASSGTRNIEELYAIVLALYAFQFVMISKNGFVNGASMFSMADINLLFTSPRKPRSLLSYGLFGQLGRSFLLGVFILYQYSWVHDSYGVGYGFILAVLVGYAVTAFVSQMLAMLIYAFTSSSDKRCRAAKVVYYLVICAFLGCFAYSVFSSDTDYISAAVKTANMIFMRFFPVAGFVQYGVVSAVNGESAGLLISIGVSILCTALFYLVISLLKSDYYEDVLKATEVSFSAITASKEGKAAENAPRNVRVGKIGLASGEGEAAIAAKHKTENRRARVFVLDMMSLVFAVITIGLGFFTKDLMLAFVMNIYFSVFTVGTGRWAKELLLPYVYLIPEPPFKKLLNMIKEQFPSFFAEAFVTFVPFYFIFKCSLSEVLGLVLAKVSFGFLFIGVNLVLQRFFGNGGNKALLIMLYFLLAAVFSIPGVALGITLGEFIPMAGAPYIIAAAANAAVGAITLYCSRNILEFAEYNNK